MMLVYCGRVTDLASAFFLSADKYFPLTNYLFVSIKASSVTSSLKRLLVETAPTSSIENGY